MRHRKCWPSNSAPRLPDESTGREYRIREPDNRAVSFSPVTLAAAGIQSPFHAPTRSGQQIFGGWTAASHPAHFLQHNLHYTQQGLWIPVATRMTGWGSRILTAAQIMADNGQALTRRAFWWTVSTVVQYNLSGRFPARDSRVELIPGSPTAAPGKPRANYPWLLRPCRGEVPERPNGRDWKSRRGYRLSRVQIPPSPPDAFPPTHIGNPNRGCFRLPVC